MLRAYNAEADSCVRTLRPHTLQTTITRLASPANTIARLGKTMNIEIDDKYHRLRLLELELTADYLVKQKKRKIASASNASASARKGSPPRVRAGEDPADERAGSVLHCPCAAACRR